MKMKASGAKPALLAIDWILLTLSIIPIHPPGDEIIRRQQVEPGIVRLVFPQLPDGLLVILAHAGQKNSPLL